MKSRLEVLRAKCCDSCLEYLNHMEQRYEGKVKDLEEELLMLQEQMMAQRTMLKDAIDHGLHLKAQLNQG
ncbi:MAG: hypothetical protein AAFQ98_11730 [Bacteroidota bacterium]